jgi:magnesium transporter
MARRPPRRGLAHHGETAAHYVVGGAPKAEPGQTAAQVLKSLRRHHHESLDILCVVDPDEALVGIVPIARLLALSPETAVGEAMEASYPRVPPDMDQERVASLALHHGLTSIPVVDHGGRLLGVVPPAALLRILRREHVEDIHRLAGISRETHRAREAIELPPIRRARHRLPWLVVGMMGSMLATLVMAGFEQALAANLAIAFFIPGLVYLADAIGTQSEAVAVRGLSLSHTRLGRLVGGEMRTGLIIGLVLGAITIPAVWIAFGDGRLAIAVALALFFAGGVASTIGLLLPWVLGRLGSDPAYGSGPLATIIQDVLSLVVYFTVVQLIVL